MSDKKLIVITGGNGFLMSNYVSEFGEKHDIIAPSKDEVNWVTGKGIDKLPSNPDVLIHAAAVMGGFVFNKLYPERILLENTSINHNVFDYLIKNSNTKAITIGSGCSYPGNATGTLTEDMIGTGRMEKTVEIYAMSKLWLLAASERLISNWSHLVLANMYGPNDHRNPERTHVVSALIQKFLNAKKDGTNVQLMGTGVAVRDNIYVSDVVDVIEKFVSIDDVNMPVNVSTGNGYTVKELASIISDIVGYDKEILWGNPEDDGALHKVLGTNRLDVIYPDRKKTTLREGLTKTIERIES
jgi:GDP-L-fucose synthase